MYLGAACLLSCGRYVYSVQASSQGGHCKCYLFAWKACSARLLALVVCQQSRESQKSPHRGDASRGLNNNRQSWPHRNCTLSPIVPLIIVSKLALHSPWDLQLGVSHPYLYPSRICIPADSFPWLMLTGVVSHIRAHCPNAPQCARQELTSAWGLDGSCSPSTTICLD